MSEPDVELDEQVRRGIDAEVSKAAGTAVSAYRVTPIDPSLRVHSVTGAVLRVATDDVDLVLKIIRRGEDPDPGALWVSGAEPGHRNYWKREWLAYSTGLLAELPGQLRAPRLALATEHGHEQAWLWLEAVEGRPGGSWPPADYASAAFDLGTTQGEYVTGAVTLPDREWLSRDWLRGWVALNTAAMAELVDDPAWDTPGLDALHPLRRRTVEVWAEHDRLLDAADAVPRTLVHLDLWPPNLLAADDGTTVAIDWSQVGVGGVGQDLDQLTLDPVWMQLLGAAELDELEAAVLPAYLAGLRTGGLDVGDSELRGWYAAAAASRYLPLLAGLVRTAADAPARAGLERRWSLPFDAILARRAAVIERALGLAAEVLD